MMKISLKFSIILVIIFFPVTELSLAQTAFLKLTSLRFECGSNYDDNILRYSSKDISRFENNNESNDSRLSTYDDWKSDFRLKFYFDGPKIMGNRSSIMYFAKLSSYFRNPFNNYSNHTLLFYQDIGSHFQVHFKYFYMPSYYLREYRDRDTGDYHSCDFTNHQARIGMDFKMTRMTQFTLQYQTEQQYYNEYFTEYDSDLWTIEGEIYHKFSWDFRVLLNAGFTVSDNVGYQPLIASAFSEFEEDTEYGDSSFEEEMYQVEVRYRKRKFLSKDTWFSLQYKLRHRIYSTDNPVTLDPIHAARLDDRHRAIFSISSDIVENLAAELSFTREWRETKSDYSSLPDIKNFKQNIFTLSLTYSIF